MPKKLKTKTPERGPSPAPLSSGPKFTPGPWKVIKPGHGLASPYLCVELDEEQQYVTLEMLPADAQLIAAAPELLAVCEATVQLMDALIRDRDVCQLDANELWCKARAAVAKALGQNPIP
jgi:hypothetical protein